MKEVNPSLGMEDEMIDAVITGFRKLREVVLGEACYTVEE